MPGLKLWRYRSIMDATSCFARRCLVLRGRSIVIDPLPGSVERREASGLNRIGRTLTRPTDRSRRSSRLVGIGRGLPSSATSAPRARFAQRRCYARSVARVLAPRVLWPSDAGGLSCCAAGMHYVRRLTRRPEGPVGSPVGSNSAPARLRSRGQGVRFRRPLTPIPAICSGRGASAPPVPPFPAPCIGTASTL